MVLFFRSWVANSVTMVLFAPSLFSIPVGGNWMVSIVKALLFDISNKNLLVGSVVSETIKPPTVLLVRVWVDSVPTKVKLWSGTVRVLFALNDEVFHWTQLVASSALAANLGVTKVLLRTVCSALVSSKVDEVAVGSLPVVTAPASGKK